MDDNPEYTARAGADAKLRFATKRRENAIEELWAAQNAYRKAIEAVEILEKRCRDR